MRAEANAFARIQPSFPIEPVGQSFMASMAACSSSCELGCWYAIEIPISSFRRKVLGADSLHISQSMHDVST